MSNLFLYNVSQGKKIACLPFFLLILLLPSLVFSATITWTGAVDTDWSIAGNWSTNSVPTSFDDVIITGAVHVFVTTNGSSAGSLVVSNGATLEIGNSINFSVSSLSVPTIQYAVKIENANVINGGIWTMIGGIWLENNATLYNNDFITNWGYVDNTPINFYLNNNSHITNSAGSVFTSRENLDGLGNRKDIFLLLDNGSTFTNLGSWYTTYSSSLQDYCVNGIVVKNGSTFSNTSGFINLNWIQEKAIWVYNDAGNTATSTFENNAPMRLRETDVNTDNTSIAILVETHGVFQNLPSGHFSMTFGGGVSPGFDNTTPQVVNNGTIAYQSTVAIPFNPGVFAINAGATLSGSGPFNNLGLDLQGGVVKPGSSPGIMVFNDPFSATTPTTFEMELAGLGGAGAIDGHDQVDFQSSPNDISNLTIDVVLIDGFVPSVGDAFVLFSGSYTGTLANFNVPGDALSWGITYNANDITLTLLSVLQNIGNIGLGTDDPKTKVHVKDGDVYLETPGSGVIMKDANGDCRKLTVDGSGNITAVLINCPQ